MKREVELYINDFPVDLSDESFILMNYTEDEADSPTAVINSFSKQITLPLTDNNAKAFGNMDIANRTTTNATFNPIQKESFKLLIGGELFESGYCRLDEVTKEDGYKLTLFGGLGSFMYSLTYSDAAGLDGNNTKTLADLTFMSDTPNEKEFDFVINAQTVRDAWNNMGSDIWKYISFAPMYNGYPKAADFVADKGIIRLGEAGLPDTVEGYRGKGNYALVNFTHDFTEWEMRDFRSYLQRPVLSIKGFMEAIARPRNNGNWTVDYAAIESGSEFQKGWISLPMIGTDTPMTEPATIAVNTVLKDWGAGSSSWLNITPQSGQTIKDGKIVVNLSVRPQISGVNFPQTPYSQNQDLYLANLGTTILPGCAGLFVQLVALNENGAVMQGSDIAYVHESYMPIDAGKFADAIGLSSDPARFGFSPANYTSINAHFTKEQGVYKLTKTLNFSLECYGAKSFRIVALAGYNRPAWGINSVGRIFWYRNNLSNYVIGSYTGLSFEEPLQSVKISYEESDALHSNSTITKRNLLGGMPSPGAMLTAIARVCGWKFLCDNAARKITIMPRSTYYNGGTIDINERIDRSKSYTIVPNSFASKYLDFALETYKGSYAEMYSGKYGRAYGSMRVNTGYDFNEEHLEMFDGIALKHAATVQEFSPYFYTVKEKNDYKPAAFRDTGNTYTLWDIVDGTSKDFDLPSLGDAAVLSALASTEIQTQAGDAKGFDDWFRVQMENNGQPVDDGSGVLLYFQGMVNTCGQLSDDDSTMLAMLGGKVCWKPFFGDGQITVPSFTTYLWSEGFGGDIILSSDMGQPQELGIPGLKEYKDDATLYARYWKKYVEDRYSVDAKVCRCYVRLDGLQVQVGNELLRYFFWFDECLWSLNKIIDYSANTDDPCLCEFIRVQDPSAYTEFVTPPTYLTANPSSLHFEANGGTKKFYISTNLQTQWNITAPSGVTVSPRYGIGDREISVTVGRSGGFVQPATIVVRDALNQLTANVTVTQDEYYLRVKNITPWPIRIPAKGGTVEFDIESNDEWTVIENDEHDALVITPDAGSGYAHVVITVPENPTLEARQFEALVSGRYGSYADIPIRIIQDKYLFDVQPREVNVPQSGTTFYLDITTQGTETPWQLELPTGVIADVTSGAGDAHIAVTVPENPYAPVDPEDPDSPEYCDYRELKLKVRFTPVAHWWEEENPVDPEDPDYDPDYDYDDDNPGIIPVLIKQAGIPRLAIDPMELHFTPEGGQDDAKTLTVTANETWTYSGPSWLTITDITPVPDPDDPDYDPDAEVNPNDKILQVVAATNSTQNPRMAYIQFQSESGIRVNVLVVQEGKIPELSVVPTSLTFPAAGGNDTVQVTANEAWNYTAPAWLTVTDITPAPGPDDPVSYNKTLRVTAAANSSTSPRVNVITFTSVSGLTENLLVTQEAQAPAPTLDIFPQTLTFDPQGETLDIQVFSNEAWNLTVPAWLTASINSGTGNAVVHLTAAANNSGSDLSGTVTAQSTSQLTATCAVLQPPMSYSYLTFTSTGGNTLAFDNSEGVNPSLEYSTDGSTWQSWDYSALTIYNGQSVYIRGNNPNGLNRTNLYGSFVIGGNGTVACSGNIMHLLDYTTDLLTIPRSGCFYRLFAGCDKLTSGPSLPATTLAPSCYASLFEMCTLLGSAPALPAMVMEQACYVDMFFGCEALRTPPALPALTLAQECYKEMFRHCISLGTPPTLPASTMAQSCYESMFAGCTSLSTFPTLPAMDLAPSCYKYMFMNILGAPSSAPALPATTLAPNCYEGMFWDTPVSTASALPALTMEASCYRYMYRHTNLPSAPSLPATTLADLCYEGMFQDCQNLTAAPVLSATTLAYSCYASMFYGCTGLISPPTLPATSLAVNCYNSMFNGCISLASAPALPATTLYSMCYAFMFYGCTSLVTAPDLPAPTLVTDCYSDMFTGCSSLNYIKALFENAPGIGYTTNWVNGVAAQGTFVMSSNAQWTPARGVDYIPIDWTIIQQ